MQTIIAKQGAKSSQCSGFYPDYLMGHHIAKYKFIIVQSCNKKSPERFEARSEHSFSAFSFLEFFGWKKI
jgi:hypothetical protein